jgi:hypothetical protein
MQKKEQQASTDSSLSHSPIQVLLSIKQTKCFQCQIAYNLTKLLIAYFSNVILNSLIAYSLLFFPIPKPSFIPPTTKDAKLGF